MHTEALLELKTLSKLSPFNKKLTMACVQGGQIWGMLWSSVILWKDEVVQRNVDILGSFGLQQFFLLFTFISSFQNSISFRNFWGFKSDLM